MAIVLCTCQNENKAETECGHSFCKWGYLSILYRPRRNKLGTSGPWTRKEGRAVQKKRGTIVLFACRLIRYYYRFHSLVRALFILQAIKAWEISLGKRLQISFPLVLLLLLL